MKKSYCQTGIRIRDLREKKHFTRETLAEMADISPKFLYEIEKGRKGFSAYTLGKLTEALQTNSDYLLFGECRANENDEVMRIIKQFDEKQRKSLLEILKLLY